MMFVVRNRFFSCLGGGVCSLFFMDLIEQFFSWWWCAFLYYLFCSMGELIKLKYNRIANNYRGYTILPTGLLDRILDILRYVSQLKN